MSSQAQKIFAGVFVHFFTVIQIGKFYIPFALIENPRLEKFFFPSQQAYDDRFAILGKWCDPAGEMLKPHKKVIM